MLGKVLKYDFKNIGKILIPLYIITLGMCGLTRVLLILGEQFRIFEVLSFLTNIGGLVLLVGTVAFTFIIVVKRFYSNLFKEEGYLTNVLPVNINTHILSKVISSLVFNILSVIVVIVSFFIMYYSLELTEGMSAFINVFKEIIIYGSIFAILALQTYEMLVCTAYSIGQRKAKNKILYSIVSGIGLYFVGQIIILSAIGITIIVQPNYIELLELGNIEAIRITLILANIANIICNIMYYFITVWSLKKKMDLG